jgi:hypothetical protein
MPAIIREVNALYDVDGFLTNGWPSTGRHPRCHCEACRNSACPNTLQGYEQHLARVLEIWKLWDNTAKQKKWESVYVGNLGGGARAVMRGRTFTNATGSYSNAHPLCRHTAKAPLEATMWMAQTTASGMTPWYHWLGGKPEDHRWEETVCAFFQWIAAHAPHFAAQQRSRILRWFFLSAPTPSISRRAAATSATFCRACTRRFSAAVSFSTLFMKTISIRMPLIVRSEDRG